MVHDKYPAVAYIGEQKNVGFGVMVNKGIDKSRGKFLFIVNADVFVTEPEELNISNKDLEAPTLQEWVAINEDVLPKNF